MAWTFTILCMLTCVCLSAAILLGEQTSFKQEMSLKGFVTERSIRANHLYFTLLSIEPTETIHFILPLEQNALILQVGDFVQVSYEQVPFVLFKPLYVRTLEKIELS